MRFHQKTSLHDDNDATQRITNLQQENEKLKAEVSRLSHQLEFHHQTCPSIAADMCKAVLERARLREALKPFANNPWRKQDDQEEWLGVHRIVSGKGDFKAKDLTAAHAALHPTEPKSEQP